MHTPQQHFALDNFEGPLDFLLCLIQREEIDIYEVSLQQLIQQCIDKLTQWSGKQIELGAEFVGTMSYFIWLKSRMLLPQTESLIPPEDLEEDPRFEIIHHLIDYCRFKQTAKNLLEREEEQQSYFYRGLPPAPGYRKPLGIDHITMEELTTLFKELMSRAALPKQQIHEEDWKVQDKMDGIRLILLEKNSFPLEELFPSCKSRLELIVIFLALLELMKLGVLFIGREPETAAILVHAQIKENKES